MFDKWTPLASVDLMGHKRALSFLDGGRLTEPIIEYVIENHDTDSYDIESATTFLTRFFDPELVEDIRQRIGR